MFRLEHDVETGEIKQIELSAEEIASLEAERAAAQAERAAAQTARLAEEQAKTAQKQLLLDRLGITQEEAQLLLGGN